MVPDLVGKIYKLRTPLVSRAPRGYKDTIIEPNNSVFKVLRMIETYDMEEEAYQIHKIEVYFFKSKQTHIIPLSFDYIELVDTELSKVLYE